MGLNCIIETSWAALPAREELLGERRAWRSERFPAGKRAADRVTHDDLAARLLLVPGFIAPDSGAWVRTLRQMSAVSRIISSYDSVVAAQDMKESLERQDSAAVFDLLGEHDRAARQAAEHRGRFNVAFDKAAANITEVGERDVVEAIRRERDDYYRQFDAFLKATGDRTSM